MRYLLCILSLFCGLAHGQKPSQPAAVHAPVIVSSESYPLLLEDHAKFRDLQHQIDQLEIDIQKMQVRIEQDKQRQAEVFQQEQAMLESFYDTKKISRDTYEIDPADLKAKPKKK